MCKAAVGIAVAMLLALLVGSPQPLRAQLPLVPQAAASPPAGSDITVKRVGNLDTAPITFNGYRLFLIAAPPAGADDPIAPIVQRVNAIEDNLRRIVPLGGFLEVAPSRFDPASFRVEVGSENGYPTLYATDERHVDSAQIMTVTEADAYLSGVASGELAKQWQGILQDNLGRAVQNAAPEQVYRRLRTAPVVVALALGMTWLLWTLRRSLERRGDAIDAANAEEVKRTRLRRRLLRALKWLLGWVGVAMWLLVILWLAAISPAWHGTATRLSWQLGAVGAVWIAIAAINAITSVFVARLSQEWTPNPFASRDDRIRLALRRPTIAAAIDNLKLILLCAVGIGLTLSIFAISTTSALTIGALAAFAVSFAAQSVVKDYVNGFCILAEDQFAIGDTITVNGRSGVVENLTLRVTQLRTDDGTLVTLANSTIAMVANATRLWSRVDFRIQIARNADVERALTLLKATLDGLAEEEPWRDAVLAPPEVLGVEEISNAGIVLRAWLKTSATHRAALSREVNRRVEEAFREGEIVRTAV
jgi:small conductance mechanosensitive channel